MYTKREFSYLLKKKKKKKKRKKKKKERGKIGCHTVLSKRKLYLQQHVNLVI